MDIYDFSFVQSIMDIKNYFRFRKEMKRESRHRDSKFNKLGLKLNWLKNVVYVQVNCTDDDLMNANYDQETMLLRKIRPIVSYLGEELGWSDYLSPQVSNFVDESGNPSLSFGVLFVFTPYRFSFTRAIFTTLITLGIIGGATWAVLKFLV